MAIPFSEEQVHEQLLAMGMETVVMDSAELTQALEGPTLLPEVEDEEGGFELWRIIKQRALQRIDRIHDSVRYGTFVGSKVDLPTDSTKPMQLDLLGYHEDGIFVLELKVGSSSERNAFSELLAYSNYIAQMFALSGPADIANVLVAPMGAKITRHAYLYDLLISNRNIIAYRPIFSEQTLESLKLELYVPTDEDFRYFANRLLSHQAMGCVVASFHDLKGWYDSEEDEGNLNDYTREALGALSTYAAQLMEAEQLHGFVFVRKPWKELPRYYRNSLIVCAVNPFLVADPERSVPMFEQMDEQHRDIFMESPRYAFDGRLLRLAKRAIDDCLAHGTKCEREVPLWEGMVHELQEVVLTHNFGFRPTGIFREAYVASLQALYIRKAAGSDEDASTLKVDEVNNWMRAWMFMEMCGFVAGEADGVVDDEEAAGEGPAP